MMSAHDLARQILSDMWEYGRLVLILVFVTVAWGFVINLFDNDREQSNTQRVLISICLGSVGFFILFSFVNVQAGNIIALMQICPAWGIFTSIVALSIIAVAGMTLYRHLAASRREAPISITGSSEQLPQGTLTIILKLTWSVLALLLLTSVIWLWYLAKG